MAGINVAIAAARLGVKVILVHERPVFGGNASSEIRMWICGTQDYAYRETGISEEINLENYYYNPTKNYHLWDSVLYNKVQSEKNIKRNVLIAVGEKLRGAKLTVYETWGQEKRRRIHIRDFLKN